MAKKVPATKTTKAIGNHEFFAAVPKKGDSIPEILQQILDRLEKIENRLNAIELKLPFQYTIPYPQPVVVSDPPPAQPSVIPPSPYTPYPSPHWSPPGKITSENSRIPCESEPPRM